MIDSFDRDENEAVARLLSDPDFMKVFEFIKKNVTSLAMSSVNTMGMESEKTKGGCIALQEFRDQIISSKTVLDRYRDQDEVELLKRDPISP